MTVNREGIFGTRPWLVFGEGPVAATSIPLHAQGFNENKYQSFSSEDMRFVTKGDTLYVHVLGWPVRHEIQIKSLKDNSPWYGAKVNKVEMLGYEKELEYHRAKDGLFVKLPENYKPNEISFVLRIQ